MRVICCGGRGYGMDREPDGSLTMRACDQRALVINVMTALPPGTIVRDGGAPGADSLAHDAAAIRGLETERFPAQWNLYGRSAGPRRNQEMLDAGTDLVIAFDGGVGTADMMHWARLAGVTVFEPDYENLAELTSMVQQLAPGGI